MGLREGKFYFESMFNDLWTQTPLHMAGMEFDGEGLAQWINPSYRPSRYDKPSLSNTMKRVYANVYIPCWADTDVDVMELMDDVIEFVETNTKSPYKINSISIIDHGWSPSNKVFGIIMVSIEHTYGYCTFPVDDQLQFTDAFTEAFQI